MTDLSLYGRKYSLQVTAPAGSGQQTVLTISDSSFEPEALRIVFNVNTPAMQGAYWYADIDIYNCDSTTTQAVIQASQDYKQGMTAILKAGYLNGNYDIIWQGPVFQPLWTRENVTDYKLTLHCILSLEAATSGNPITQQYQDGMNQTEIVLDMIKNLGLAPVGPSGSYISPNLSTKSLPRGKTVFGSASDVLTEIAEDNNCVWFLSQRGLPGDPASLNMGKLDDGSLQTEAGFVYTPTTGLLGTPVQTQHGVNFSVLLDPRIKAQLPLQTVGIKEVVTQQLPRVPNQTVYTLSPTGTYVVGAVRHRGDSRGNTWQTEITGYRYIGGPGGVLELLGINGNAYINR